MLSKPGNGGFIPSCHDHENFNDIDGVAFDTDQLLALFDGTATVTADTCVKARDELATRRLRELGDDDFSVISVGGAARAMGCRESDFRADDDDMSMVSSASRSGRKKGKKSERRLLVDKGAPKSAKTYGKCAAAPASRGEGFYEL